MPTPIQITVTVDPAQSVAALQQIGAAATDVGNKTAASGLKGAAAVAALTEQWEKEQVEIAKATALMEQQTAATAAQEAATRRAASAFQGITSEQTKASIAGRILEQQFGITNRALNQVISRSSIAGPLMAGLFNVAIIDAGFQAFSRVHDAIIKITDDMGGYTDAVKQSYAEVVKVSQDAFINPKFADIAQRNLASINKQIDAIEATKKAIDNGNENSFSSMEDPEAAIYASVQKTNDATEQGNQLTDKQNALIQRQGELRKQINDELAQGAAANALIGLSGFAKINQELENAQNQIKRMFPPEEQNGIEATSARTNAQDRADKETAELHKDMAMQVMQIDDRIAENNLQGIAKIRLQEADQIKEEEAGLVKKLGLSQQEVDSTKLFQDKKKEIHQDAETKIREMQAQTQAQTVALQNDAELSGLSGDAKIIQSAENRAQKERDLFAKGLIDYDTYSARIVAIDKIRNDELTASDESWLEKRKALLDKDAEEFKDANDAAALASVPPWQKAYAQIIVESEKRLAAIDQQERAATALFGGDQEAMVAITALAQAKRGAVWAEENEKIAAENQKLTEQLGSDLESIFNDISSGNIGQRILKNMEKLFFQIVAQWLLASQTMGSTFGKVFSTLIGGPGSTLENSSGGGIGSLIGLSGGTNGSFASFGAGAPANGTGAAAISIPGLPGSSAGSASSGSGFDFGGLLPPGVSDGQSVPGATGTGSLTTTAISALGGGSIPGLASSGASSGVKSGASSLFSSQGIAGLGALALAMGGGKIGGIPGQIGGIISSLTIMAALNPIGPAANILSKLGLFGNGIGGTLLAAAGPALLGFGVGTKFGPLGGTLAGGAVGFGTGALIGLAGGPIGALVGGIVGAIAGLFGGLFGSSKRKKQANAYFDSQVGPAIQKIEDDFKGFSVDYATSISNLEDLRTQSQTQLGTLKGQGNDVFNKKVVPAIDAAEAVINQDETERLRRQGLVFGPPQFHDGGYVNAGAAMFTQRPGELLAMLKHGEFVMNPSATTRIGVGNLHAANSGGGFGGTTIGTIEIHPTTLDRAYLRSPNGFQKDLADAVVQMKKEGRL